MVHPRAKLTHEIAAARCRGGGRRGRGRHGGSVKTRLHCGALRKNWTFWQFLTFLPVFDLFEHFWHFGKFLAVLARFRMYGGHLGTFWDAQKPISQTLIMGDAVT